MTFSFSITHFSFELRNDVGVHMNYDCNTSDVLNTNTFVYETSDNNNCPFRIYF